MAEPSNKNFNLLYKIEAQKSFVDRLYEFVVGPARIVVVGVMLVIIIAFLIRFPLDSALNDQVKLARTNQITLTSVLGTQEPTFNSTVTRIAEVKKFENLYKDPDIATTTGKRYQLSYGMTKILAVKANYPNDIIISDYSLSNDTSETSIKINGGASTFEVLDSFVKELRQIDIVSDAASVSQTGQRGQIPKFSIDIKLKQ